MHYSLFWPKISLKLQDAFSLLAYSNPWSSPLGWHFCPSRRETVCAALNSAILGKAHRTVIRIPDTLIPPIDVLQSQWINRGGRR